MTKPPFSPLLPPQLRSLFGEQVDKPLDTRSARFSPHKTHEKRSRPHGEPHSPVTSRETRIIIDEMIAGVKVDLSPQGLVPLERFTVHYRPLVG
jgi:hypothetical protein